MSKAKNKRPSDHVVWEKERVRVNIISHHSVISFYNKNYFFFGLSKCFSPLMLFVPRYTSLNILLSTLPVISLFMLLNNQTPIFWKRTLDSPPDQLLQWSQRASSRPADPTVIVMSCADSLSAGAAVSLPVPCLCHLLLLILLPSSALWRENNQPWATCTFSADWQGCVLISSCVS